MTSLKVYEGRDLFPSKVMAPLVKHSDVLEPAESFSRADLVLLPHDEVFDEWSSARLEAVGVPPHEQDGLRARYRDLVERAASATRPTVFVRHSDFSVQIPVPDNGIVVQANGHRSARHRNEFALAGFGALGLDPSLDGPADGSTGRPSVSFQGSARLDRVTPERVARDAATWLRRAGVRHRLVQRAMWSEGQLVRDQALLALERAPQVDLDALRITRAFLTASEQDRERNRASYLERMLASPYALVARGRGNFSYRLYEAMELRRIPVFIDTDSILPFDDEIDWRDEFVWVDEDAIDRIGDVVAERHPPTTQQLHQWQQRMRDLWEGYCRPKAYWSHLGNRIVDLLR